MISFIKRIFEKHKECECEFEGAYFIRASTMRVEMNCKKCGKLHSWTFEQWEQMFPDGD